jgi:hypothetical protein
MVTLKEMEFVLLALILIVECVIQANSVNVKIVKLDSFSLKDVVSINVPMDSSNLLAILNVNLALRIALYVQMIKVVTYAKEVSQNSMETVWNA